MGAIVPDRRADGRGRAHPALGLGGAPASRAPAPAPAPCPRTVPLPDGLPQVLAVLADTVDPALADEVAELSRRLGEDRMRLLVVGEAKRGKSSLVNALLGLDLLPTGAVPVTALATTIVHDTRTFAAVDYFDGRTETVDVGELARFVTEQQNPSNRLGVRTVTVHADAPLLAAGVELVDTPGTGSIHEHNTASAVAAFSAMDTAIMTVSADVPLSEADRALLAQVADASVRVFCVLTKTDHLSRPELAEVLQFVRDAVAGELGTEVEVYPCSVRAPSDPGLRRLGRDLQHYLTRTRGQDLRSSLVRRARRLLDTTADEIVLAQRVLDEDESAASDLVRGLVGLLAAFGDDRAGSDLIDVAGRAVLADLDARAAVVDHDLRVQASSVVEALLGGRLLDSGPRGIEADGRRLALEALMPTLEQWRGQAQQIVSDGLALVEARVARQGEHDVAELQQRAKEQLGVELLVELPDIELPERRTFFYLLAPPPSQTELTAAAVRHLLPGRPGRTRAAAHLRHDVEDVVTSQAGRIRAHMQGRLAEALRELTHASHERRRATVERLRGAGAAAEQARRGTSTQATQLRTALSSRASQLATARAALDRVPTDTIGPSPRRVASQQRRQASPSVHDDGHHRGG